MNILITGAAGMVGRKLTEELVRRGEIGGRALTGLTLIDIVPPIVPDGVPGAALSVDMADPAAAQALIEQRPDVIFHLAAIVSGEAEADFEKGYGVNLDGTLALLRAVAAQPDYCPRFVFTSSIAVFGAPLPDPIPDDHTPEPLTSYGTQKAMGELMVNDLSRRGLIDGISLRFPTICIRPGKPNAAASGFFSGILREPLNGQEAILPVPDDVKHWHASPRAAVAFLIQAAEMDLTPMGPRRALSLPGVAATVGEQIAALERVAGPEAVALIRREPDETIMRIVEGWPRSFDPARARKLGFEAEPDMDTIIRVYIEDELDGRLPVQQG
ncbi:D-erythronate dehydrogenase [Jannaschia aquimarina]|uniref:Putative epimerase/dehydratase n=1 Tax=Jannaschia aquimarina TaxID=935700 RepID=A0A0D1EBG0_9RHOB|nr:D-erythronate dehydrogenase [Jannaschia aquimarina]KIT15079.1 putative epimerase/dehydratase [Jannaschia aquimarina]SNS63506.1 Nucleoside-diphosphate-sugar epimerase [Jannaschia aquimarina]